VIDGASERRSRGARLTRWIEAGLGLAAALLLFAMMALTFVDVVGRYLFNRSVTGAFEITEIMMALLIFAGLPLVVSREEHVTVDLVDHFTPPRLRRVYRVVVELASALLMFGLAHLMWRKAGRSAAYGDMSTVLLIKYAPFVYAICVFLVIAGAVHVYNALARQPPRD
jgi:TRAP-type C4-dicarboxylate transport system permease small subunit